MKYIQVTLLVFILSLSLGQLALADPFEGVSHKTIKLSENVYMLQGVGGFAGGNIGVSAGEDGILIIDDQFAPLADKIKAALGDIAKGDLRFVLNTHWHGDHTGGNREFGKQATIVAHENVRKRLQTPQENRFGKSLPQPKEAWPVITFDQSLSFHMNGEEIEFIHFPGGHTDGDGVVYFRSSNVVHVGDLFFVDVFPFVDINSNGNVLSYAKNVKSIIDSVGPDVKIIPGHGPLSNLQDYKRFHTMLVETTDYVKAQLDAGLSVEQVQEKGLPEKWSSWGGGFIKAKDWIKFIHQSL